MREKRKNIRKKDDSFELKKIAKKQSLQEKGITLIAIVVTIIILLILAGVTLNIALSDNGLFNKAKKAAEDYKSASESEAMRIYMMSSQLENKEDKLGNPLLDRKVENANNWNIVVDKRNNKSYGTGWNYVVKGTEIEGFGTTKSAFLINYETGEIVQLEEGEYDLITIDDTLKVKDDLIINIDSAMVDKGISNNKKSIEDALGLGVELHNFEFNNDGILNNEFVLDGENDFITVNYDEIKNEKSEKWFENGFTIELYGTVNKGSLKYYGKDNFGVSKVGDGEESTGIFQINYSDDSQTEDLSRKIYFCYLDQDRDDGRNLWLYFMQSSIDHDDDVFNGSGYWIKGGLGIELGQESYNTISIMKSEDGEFSQTYYQNGKFIASRKIG